MKGTAVANPLLALLLLFGVGTQAPQGFPGTGGTPDMPAIDDYIEAEMRANHIPGLALAIVQGDSIVKVRGYGVAGGSEGLVTPQTAFPIGEAADSFTALAAMQLAEAGSLDIDAPVQRYIPWFQVADPAASPLITPRHLLSHTSGLSTWTGRALAFSGTVASGASLESQVRALQSAHLTHAPGTGFAYSSANYAVLSLIVQVVSEQPYEEYVQEHILAPLGMQHTYFPPAIPPGVNPAAGHRLIFGLPVRLSPAQSGAGSGPASLAASAQDLAHYLVACLSDGQDNSDDLLSEARITEMETPQVDTGGTVAFEGYGMGWMAGEMSGIPIVAQRGDLPGFHADLLLMPTEGWGIALLANANCALGPAKTQLDSLSLGIAARLTGSEPTPPPLGGSLIWVAVLLAAGVGLMVQISAIARSLAHYRRHRLEMQMALRRRRFRVLRVLWPIALPLAVALVILVAAPAALSAPLGVTLLYQPDLAYPLIANAALALLWCALQSSLTAWAIWGPAVAPRPEDIEKPALRV